MSTNLRDLNSVSPLPLIGPRALTTSVTGATQDMLQRDNLVSALLIIGDETGTGGPTLNVTLQESTDGTTWTECIGANGLTAGTFAQATTSNVSEIKQIQRTARYMRAANVVAGTTSPSFAGTVLLFEMKKQV